MTTPQQHPKKPSAKLLATLKKMANERGVTFAYPATMQEGRERFEDLKRIPRLGRGDRRREDVAVRRAMAKRGGATRVTDDELAGYGSTAGYSKKVEDEDDGDSGDVPRGTAFASAATTG
jgi:hypothetical protein